MPQIKELQEKIYKNKLNKGFNVTNVHLEINLIMEELAEVFHAYHRKEDDLGEEIADVIIYCMGLASILNIDIEKELLNKIEKNDKRTYSRVNGVLKDDSKNNKNI